MVAFVPQTIRYHVLEPANTILANDQLKLAIRISRTRGTCSPLISHSSPNRDTALEHTNASQRVVATARISRGRRRLAGGGRAGCSPRRGDRRRDRPRGGGDRRRHYTSGRSRRDRRADGTGRGSARGGGNGNGDGWSRCSALACEANPVGIAVVFGVTGVAWEEC